MIEFNREQKNKLDEIEHRLAMRYGSEGKPYKDCRRQVFSGQHELTRPKGRPTTSQTNSDVFMPSTHSVKFQTNRSIIRKVRSHINNPQLQKNMQIVARRSARTARD